MTVVDVRKDLAARRLTIVAEFEAGPERVWGLWSDPDRLGAWWPPPGRVLTVTAHDLRPGGEVAYSVGRPGVTPVEGRWRIHSLEPPHRLEFTLENPGGYPEVEVAVEVAPRGSSTRMTTRFAFADDAAMEELLAIGFDLGVATAIGQAATSLCPVPPGP